MTDWLPIAQSELARLLPSAAPAGGIANPYQAPQAPWLEQPASQEPAVRLTWAQVFWGFDGRIPRRIYWLGMGVWIGIFIILAFILGMLSELSDNPDAITPFFLILLIPYIWSSLALQVKRWHDRGKSGFMVLVNLIPYIGGLWAFIECGCLRGSEGPNRFGGDPT